MPQVVLPLADVLVATDENLGAFTFHLPVLEVALVPGLIGPDHYTFTFHVIVVELTLIKFTRVRKVVLAAAMELTVQEVSFIKTTLELEFSLARLFSKYERANEADFAEIPRFGALAVLPIVLPLTIIHVATGVDEDALTIGLVIFPLALEDVTVGMGHAALSIEHTVFRLSIVARAVRELYDADVSPLALLVQGELLIDTGTSFATARVTEGRLDVLLHASESSLALIHLLALFFIAELVGGGLC